MPKTTKLHSKTKGKPTSMQKPCNADKDSTSTADSDDSMSQFQLELCWCIQQLERSIGDKKANEKQMQEAWKVLTVLKNNNQPMIRKRQLMRTHFGDYRAKMASEEKKLAKMASKMKISDGPAHAKATFLRKSAFLTTGDSSFRFDFNVTPDAIDNGNPGTSHIDTETSSINDVVKFNDTVTNSGDTKASPTKEGSSKTFKFNFTHSNFKFNFDVDGNP